MGVWSTLKAALGLDPVPPPADTNRLEVSPAAEQRLAALPDGHGVSLTLEPTRAGWLVVVTEGEVPHPHPELGGWPIAADDDVPARLAGLTLDHTDGRWRIVAEVRVSARETPNPDGRLYLTNRTLSAGRRAFGPQASGAPWLVQRLLERDDIRSVLVRGSTLTVERTPEAPWPPIDAAVGTAVREHVLSAGGVIPADVDDERDDLETAVWQILEHRVLPALHRDGGDLELVGIEDGVVQVHLVGACRTCPASTLTLQHGIERTLLDAFPGEIDAVEAV